MSRMSMVRTRWAAVGAAVAVTLGAGGLVSVGADSAASLFVAIEPTRVLDTRIDVGLTGAFAAGQNRVLDVTGNVPIVTSAGTKGNATVVPDGATAVVANVTAVFPTTAGFVAVRPGTATGEPTTSNVNFTTGGVVAPNSVAVELPTSGADAGKVALYFKGTAPTATTHLLFDVVGYYVAGDAGGATKVSYLTRTFSMPGDVVDEVATPTCPVGQRAVSAGIDPDWPIGDLYPFPEEFSFVSRPDSALQFRRWIVEYQNLTAAAVDVTLYSVCIAAEP